MKEMLIKLPLCNQHDAEHDLQWSYRICAICSLWMLLKFHNPELDVSVMDLVKKGLAKGGYLERIGWKHAVIVELAKDFGLELQYAKKFFYTPEEKESGLLIINRNLKNGQPVLVSIHPVRSKTPPSGGSSADQASETGRTSNGIHRSPNSHMLVVNGLQESEGKLIGYYIQDPDGRVRGHNYFLTKQEFLSSWRGGLIHLY